MVGDRRLDTVLANGVNRSAMKIHEAVAMSAAVNFVARFIQIYPKLKGEFEIAYGEEALETILELVE